MNFKKLLKIIIVLLVVVLVVLAVLIWREQTGGKEEAAGSFAEQSSAQDDTSGLLQEQTSAAIPLAKKQRLQLIVDRPILGLSLENNKIKYFDQKTGYLYKYNPQTNQEKLIKQESIPGLISASWSPDGQKAIINNQEGQFFYNYQTNQVLEVDLPGQFVWSPDSQKIAFVCSSGICLSQADGLEKEILFETDLRDLKLNWQKDGLYFWQKPSFYAPSIVYLLALESTESLASLKVTSLQKIQNTRYGLDALPFKDQLLYSSQGKLFAQKTNLEINGLASKCVWQDKDIIYCAGPSKWPEGAIIPDDYYQNKFSTNDIIWQINLKDKIKKEVRRTNFDIQKMRIFKNYLYFINKKSGYLYLLRIGD